MATGHVLPGFGDPISRMRRVRSAGYPLDKDTLLRISREAKLSEPEIQRIKDHARQLWSYKRNHETTYDSFYCERPADNRVTIRPTSPTRRNKPHPSQVFLINRLHYIPGYHNANTTMGKDVYRVDSSLPVDLKEQRIEARQKYQGLYEGAGLGRSAQNMDPFDLKQKFEIGRSAQGAEAWLKIADEKDHEKVYNAVHQDEERIREQIARDSLDVTKENRKGRSAYPSVYRWMKRAGAKEADEQARLDLSIDTKPHTGYNMPNPYHGRAMALNPEDTVLEMRKRDIQASANIRFRPKPSRGDFLMHPEWPPTIPHHRVP